ncbi:MAG TPA: gamma-glutamyltransferase, partial [Microbacterium sp.]|nr:gamma-glutamyltransferase [Microbacterium sp.]
MTPTSGAIATPHRLATQAGKEAYEQGGNALDAALAAAAVLSVVYPHNTGIGGDLVAVVQAPDGRVHGVNATGWAAASGSLER